MGYIKSAVKQRLLRFKHRRKNIIGRNVTFSIDTVIGNNCIVKKNVTFHSKVTLNRNVNIGQNSFLSNLYVDSGSIIESFCICVGNKKGMIKIGANVYIGISNYLDNSDDITIGNNVQIAGPSTAIYTHTGAYMAINGISLSETDTTPYRTSTPVVIENNVYVGCNCTIYPGIIIGHHSIVAPNSAVTKNVEPYTMVGGVPAKLIKRIDSIT